MQPPGLHNSGCRTKLRPEITRESWSPDLECVAAILGDLRSWPLGGRPGIVSPARGAGAACAGCARCRPAAIRFRMRPGRAGTWRSVPGRSSAGRTPVPRCGPGAFASCRTVVISDVAPGTTCGNQRADFPRHPGASQGMVSAGRAHEAGSVSWTFLWAVFALQARSRWFEPTCAHQSFRS
jgi:hypothetical protein